MSGQRIGEPSFCCGRGDENHLPDCVLLAEVKWLRKVAKFAEDFRDLTTEATRGLDMVPGTMPRWLRAKARLEDAINEARIARETASGGNP